jgi:hypothetical protein
MLAELSDDEFILDITSENAISCLTNGFQREKVKWSWKLKTLPFKGLPGITTGGKGGKNE